MVLCTLPSCPVSKLERKLETESLFSYPPFSSLLPSSPARREKVLCGLLDFQVTKFIRCLSDVWNGQQVTDAHELHQVAFQKIPSQEPPQNETAAWGTS